MSVCRRPDQDGRKLGSASVRLSVSPTIIEDYAATAGKVRSVATGLNHSQPGDPAKLAKVLVDFADVPHPPIRPSAHPPVRLPLGSDTVAAIRAKHASDNAILAQ